MNILDITDYNTVIVSSWFLFAISIAALTVGLVGIFLPTPARPTGPLPLGVVETNPNAGRWTMNPKLLTVLGVIGLALAFVLF